MKYTLKLIIVILGNITGIIFLFIGNDYKSYKLLFITGGLTGLS